MGPCGASDRRRPGQLNGATGMRQRRAQRDPPVQGALGFLALDRKHMPQALFEQVGAIQAGVGLSYPGQLRGSAFGAVLLGALPQRSTGALSSRAGSPGWTRRGVQGGAPATPIGLAAGDNRLRVVPGPAALGIERLGPAPGYHMKTAAHSGIDAGQRLLTPRRRSSSRRRPARRRSTHTARRPSGVEKPAQGGGVAARRGPHNAATAQA